MSKQKQRNWFIKEKSRKQKVVLTRFTRQEWVFLEHVRGVEKSLDALFGLEVRPKFRFTEK